jgi:predicted RNA-binding protein with PIN domain
MAFLIDGNNLLGHLFPGGHRDPALRILLIRRLQAFQRQTRTRVILVFDGPPPDDAPLPAGDKFTVVFPPEGESADTAIEDYISRPRDRRNLVVVTSDRALRTFARAAGAVSLPCDAFSRELKKVLRARREARELEKFDDAATKLEVELWAQAFARKR